MPSLEEYHLLFEHYKLAVEDIARMNDRRRVNSDVYIGLNTFLLTGMVFLLSMNQAAPWILPIIFLVITVLAFFINQTWRSSLASYRTMINLRVAMLQEIEERLQGLYQQIVAAENAPVDIRVFMKEAQNPQQPGFTRVELRLTWLFLIVYPLMTLGTILLALLGKHHLP